MNSGQNGTDPRSKTPPIQQKALPPTPPTTDKRPGPGRIATVEDLRRYRAAHSGSNKDDADEIIEIPISSDFDPHYFEDDIQTIFPRFDCCAKYHQGLKLRDRKILVRMPSRIHEGFIADIEKESYRQLDQVNSKRLNIEIGRSSRVRLNGGTESRQPDTQYILDTEDVPCVIVEVAYTQPGSRGKRIAGDYVFGTCGKVKRVFVFDLNPVGEASTVSEWRTKITASDDPNYEGDLSIEAVMFKEFRAADGSPANVQASFKIPYSDFDSNIGAKGHVISISFLHLYDLLGKLEKKRPQPDLGHAEPSSKRLRFRRSPSTSVEKLLSDREEEFQKAENVEDDESDFSPDTDESEESLGNQKN